MKQADLDVIKSNKTQLDYVLHDLQSVLAWSDSDLGINRACPLGREIKMSVVPLRRKMKVWHQAYVTKFKANLDYESRE